jgi:hypothetical protein
MKSIIALEMNVTDVRVRIPDVTNTRLMPLRALMTTKSSISKARGGIHGRWPKYVAAVHIFLSLGC